MSTLKVNTIQDASGGNQSTAEQIEQGRAKAYCRFNGVTPAITSSFNVSSLTDYSTGSFGVNFTTAMSDANYAYAFGHDSPYNTSINPNQHTIMNTHHNAPTASLIRFRFYNPVSSGHLNDPTRACVIVFGDQ